MKIAVLGGTFNPVHIGHLTLAQEVILSLGYDTVLFVPAYVSPFKQFEDTASAEQRCKMLSLAISTESRFCLELCEIERGGVSYTYETIEYLNKKFCKELQEESLPQFRKVGFIMGSDLIEGFNRWKRADFVAANSTILLAERGSSSQFEYEHIKLNNALLPVSSSAIREKIQSGKSWQYLVTPEVYSYIIKGSLYGFRSR